ncbi:hypothetical protein [Streptomyces sp. WM6386]|uniref:hypothetical protein n=1 Tax=Streptomyces sp. WM6386 TaxID=1415558 RepID=UPI000A670442|nr:hypothetical protein [Streptomyces sp. WM6386]
MSGEKNHQDPYKPEHQEAAHQNGTLDAVMDMTKLNPFGGSGTGFHFGKTNFEGHDLNQMIDIVESANPELLENAGTSLVAARDAINDAADELSRNLGKVDWEGDAHTAFYDWGMDLVTTALGLAGYADVVGTQVMAASSGLASVRKSMPPRDTRTDPKAVDDIPEAKRVDANDEYTAAVKAEGDRQEAINQMYRLASFYTVSGAEMQRAEEPVFPKMPDVGVPAPPPDFKDPRESMPRQRSLSSSNDSGIASNSAVDAGVKGAHSGEQLPSHKNVDASASPTPNVGTEIDSVGTLPPQETMKPTPAAPPSTTGPSITPVGTTAPVAPVAAPPAGRGLAGRTSGFGGVPRSKAPASAQGRGGGVSDRAPAARTGTGPMGRTTAPGQASGRTPGPMGRGVVGGVPKAGGAAAKSTGSVPRGPVTGMGATNPARAGGGRPTNGVLGGKPVTGAASGVSGPRTLRGNVIGGEGAPSAARPAGERPGQRGVIGAPASTPGAGQAPRRPAGSSDGVLGTPRAAPGRGASRTTNDGQTPGGTRGVPRGSAGNQGSGRTRSRRDERRDGPSSTD